MTACPRKGPANRRRLVTEARTTVCRWSISIRLNEWLSAGGGGGSSDQKRGVPPPRRNHNYQKQSLSPLPTPPPCHRVSFDLFPLSRSSRRRPGVLSWLRERQSIGRKGRKSNNARFRKRRRLHSSSRNFSAPSDSIIVHPSSRRLLKEEGKQQSRYDYAGTNQRTDE